MTTEILFPHTAIHVKNLDASIDFYKNFFGVEPIKVKPQYAKFELQNPRWNFSLNEVPSLSGSNQVQPLSHLGFQVATTKDVLKVKLRLEDAGLLTQDEMNTTCCYALQDKFWVKDPNGIDWEVFTVIANAEVMHDNAPHLEPTEKAICCTPLPKQAETVHLNLNYGQA